MFYRSVVKIRKIFHLFTVLTRILPYMFYELDDGLRESFSRSRRCSVIKGVLNIFFANSSGKHQYWSLFLIKLQASRPATLLKINSNTGVFLRILRNF